MATFIAILIFIIILGILVFVHELGHFSVAKWFGVRVDEFGMGFPPRAMRLFKRGETEYTLNWIPFGGFVKIYGEDSLGEDGKSNPDYARSLGAKKWWQQILVLIAGVVMNVLLAWIIFTGALLSGAPTLASQTEHPELLRNAQLTVIGIAPNSPANEAGIVAGEAIVSASHDEATLTEFTPDAFTQFIQSTPTEGTVMLELAKGSTTREIAVTPVTTINPGTQAIGVSIDRVGIAPGLRLFPAIGQGFVATYQTVGGTFRSFGQLVTGKVSLNALSGPVGLTQMVGDAQKVGFGYLAILTAIISINLAVINILPFPALDGGRILVVIIEILIRRPLPSKFIGWLNGAGFIFLILLMLAVTAKDIVKLF